MEGVILLRQAEEAGLKVNVDGDHLVVRGPRRAEVVVRKLFANKKAILDALVPPKLDSAGWRALLAERLRYWRSFRPDGEARQIAWGDLECRWHTRYGERVTSGFCAGCRRPLGERRYLRLGDGNAVHFGDLGCLLAFGDRWRSAAAQGLEALGLEPPRGDRDDELRE